MDGPHFRKPYAFKDARWTRGIDAKPTLPPFIGEKPLSFQLRIQQSLLDKVNAMVSGKPDFFFVELQSIPCLSSPRLASFSYDIVSTHMNIYIYICG